MRFSGLARCTLDATGRVKLSPKVIQDLTDDGRDTRDIVLYCLPEGGLALFPEETWQAIRSKAETETPDLLNDIELRRRSRRIAANTDSQPLSNQGRITIPQMFREKLGMECGKELVITGNERGYELWSIEKWAGEMEQ